MHSSQLFSPNARFVLFAADYTQLFPPPPKPNGCHGISSDIQFVKLNIRGRKYMKIKFDQIVRRKYVLSKIPSQLNSSRV